MKKIATLFLLAIGIWPSASLPAELQVFSIYSTDNPVRTRTTDVILGTVIGGFNSEKYFFLTIQKDSTDVTLNNPLYFCSAVYKNGSFVYHETPATPCPPKENPDKQDHFHFFIPNNLGSENDPELFLGQNGWISVIRAKNKVEAHYMNVCLAPRYRPYLLPLKTTNTERSQPQQ